MRVKAGLDNEMGILKKMREERWGLLTMTIRDTRFVALRAYLRIVPPYNVGISYIILVSLLELEIGLEMWKGGW